MQAVILIGGMGTRLGARVADCPKPLLPVCNRPFFEYTLDLLHRHGISDILLLAGYRAGDVLQSYGRDSGAGERLGMRIQISVEPEPLGTAGALKHAEPYLDDRFFLLNGDTLFDFNLLDLTLDRGNQADPRPPTLRMALRPVADASRYGLVRLEGERVVGFSEKPAQGGGGLVNAGVYWVAKSSLDEIKSLPCSLEQEVIPALLSTGQVHGRVYNGYFVDIGTPKDLAVAETALPSALRRPAVFFDRDNTLIEDHGYTHRIEDLVWLDDAPMVIKRLNDAGVYVFVVTNQAGVAKGHFTEADLSRFHAHMNTELRAQGAHIDAFRHCPHHVDGHVRGYAQACDWRKPNAGMIRDLLAHWPVDPARSLAVGDKDSDLEAGRNAGLATRKCGKGELGAIVEDYLSRLEGA